MPGNGAPRVAKNFELHQAQFLRDIADVRNGWKAIAAALGGKLPLLIVRYETASDRSG
jgi:hypothetical protein